MGTFRWASEGLDGERGLSVQYAKALCNFFNFPIHFRSKIKSAKRNSNDFKIDDLFGASSYPKDTTKYPTTVPIAKGTTRNNSILGDIFDSTDTKHFSAGVAMQRRRQPSQQVFVSNSKLVDVISIRVQSISMTLIFSEAYWVAIKANTNSTMFQ